MLADLVHGVLIAGVTPITSGVSDGTGGEGINVTVPWLPTDGTFGHQEDMSSHELGRLWKFQASEIDGWVRCGGANSSDPAAPRSQISARRSE